eukprot:CAMPEP_0194285966 /NCGR_PEP_ID=MMETSP0169-20130528/31467_1 /TAXON_ID=218684 /ORGANISM="Corethron pennatum, Strain L29A3" /LENGTH=116 /DNA_ID=CAMNT_0039032235 /DNA_START=225 /DNA_END=571 /DNA_ORIENTATION=-
MCGLAALSELARRHYPSWHADTIRADGTKGDTADARKADGSERGGKRTCGQRTSSIQKPKYEGKGSHRHACGTSVYRLSLSDPGSLHQHVTTSRSSLEAWTLTVRKQEQQRDGPMT